MTKPTHEQLDDFMRKDWLEASGGFTDALLCSLQKVAQEPVIAIKSPSPIEKILVPIASGFALLYALFQLGSFALGFWLSTSAW